MKKVVALILGLMMVMMCVSVFAEEQEPTESGAIDPTLVLGDWYGETAGVVINIRLNEGGIAQCFVGSTESGEDLIWSLDGDVVTVSDQDGSDPLSGSYADDKLPLRTEDGTEVLFTREKIEIYTPAEVNTEAKVEDFNGTWKDAYASLAGLMVAVSDSTDLYVFDNGKITFAGEENAMVDFFGSDPVELTFENGTLSYHQALTTDEDPLVFVLDFTMLQDGLVCMSFDMDEDEDASFIYLTKVEDTDVSNLSDAALQGALTGIANVAEGLEKAVEDVAVPETTDPSDEVVSDQTTESTEPTETPVGDWYVKRVGAVIHLTLNEDGTASMEFSGAKVFNEVLWSLDGDKLTISMDGTILYGEFTDGVVKLDDEGELYAFSRDPIALFVEADVKADVAEDAFNGVWRETHIAIEDSVLEVAADSAETMVIKDGIMTFVGEENDVTFFAGNPIQLAFKDGSLVYAKELDSDDGHIDVTIECNVLEDDSLKLTLDVGYGPSPIYFERVTDSLVASAIISTAETVAENAREVVEAHVDEPPTDSFFHDPEGWSLEADMSMNQELNDMFNKAMESEKRFTMQPVLHLGTKVNEDSVTHCFLCVIGSLENTSDEALFMIYLNVPNDGDPEFYAGLELMLTLSPYEQADAE